MVAYLSGYSNSRKKKKSRTTKIILWFFLLLVIALLIAGFLVYKSIYKPNVWTSDNQKTDLFINTGSDFEDVKNTLYENGNIINRKNFEWIANKKNYPANIKAGRYIISPKMSNIELIDLLRSGEQTPVNVTFSSIRTIEYFSSIIASQLEPDSTSFMSFLADDEYLEEHYGFQAEDVKTMFIPNTYEFYWTTTAEDFLKKMNNEYKKFWTKKRKQKAKALNLSPKEVSILASIVEKETNKNDEKARIAGVYLNRIKNGWFLQADPTLVYAAQDFGIKRVLNKHKKIDSPYNTYVNLGLPPAPISFPSIASIDAVLNAEDHSYFYFCAKSDFSGYHAFAKTYAQHKKNARKFQKALDAKGVFK